MKPLLYLFCLSATTLLSKAGLAQQNDDLSKNRLDFMAIGNRGLINVIYNRIVFENNNVVFLPNVGTGIFPGSHDKDTIPGFINFAIGPNLEVGGKLDKLVLGICYSLQKKYGQDKGNSATSVYTNGLLGEIGYSRSTKDSDFTFKICYTPVLAGEAYRKLENAPFAITLCARLW